MLWENEGNVQAFLSLGCSGDCQRGSMSSFWSKVTVSSSGTVPSWDPSQLWLWTPVAWFSLSGALQMGSAESYLSLLPGGQGSPSGGARVADADGLCLPPCAASAGPHVLLGSHHFHVNSSLIFWALTLKYSFAFITLILLCGKEGKYQASLFSHLGTSSRKKQKFCFLFFCLTHPMKLQ